MGSHFGVGAPLILEPILVGIGMFTGGVNQAFDLMAKWKRAKGRKVERLSSWTTDNWDNCLFL